MFLATYVRASLLSGLVPPEWTAVDREGIGLSGMVLYLPDVIDCTTLLEPMDWLVELSFCVISVIAMDTSFGNWVTIVGYVLRYGLGGCCELGQATTSNSYCANCLKH